MSLNPAADKLPLAVRKNIRDEWDAKRPKFESELSDLLGESWTINADVNLIHPNVKDADYASRLGTVIVWYMEPFIKNVKTFVEKYGDDGKQELNSLASSHTVNFGPQDTTKFSYGGLLIENNVLRLVYNAPGSFASNVSDVSTGLAAALQKASESSGGGSAYDIVARNGVKEKYDPKIEAVRQRIETQTGIKGIVLKPNFEENAEALSKNPKTRDDWNRILGAASLDYFENLARALQSNKFEHDEMLQEGFQEAVGKGEISLRVVDKLASGSYNCVLVEDDVLIIQTTPTTWWSNVSDTGAKIVDIL